MTVSPNFLAARLLRVFLACHILEPLASPFTAATPTDVLLPNVRTANPHCKSVPGSAGWPSDAAWHRFNESTGGRLLRASPRGALCHPGQPNYDTTKCPVIQSAWRTYDFHQEDPVSSMWNQFNNDTCLPDPSSPCSGEGYPIFVLNATTAQHVKLGIDFGRIPDSSAWCIFPDG